MNLVGIGCDNVDSSSNRETAHKCFDGHLPNASAFHGWVYFKHSQLDVSITEDRILHRRTPWTVVVVEVEELFVMDSSSEIEIVSDYLGFKPLVVFRVH
jgi:hypothetical protein